MRLCVGDDWAEDHHDIEVMDEAGRVLARKRLPEGVAGIGQLHELIGRFVPADGDAEVRVGIETDRGPWVTALLAAGYTVFPVNPLQASRYRSRYGVSGAKSDGGDAHMLADVVRTDAHQLRPAADGSAAAGAVKVLARTHKTLIWERTAVVLRLRAQLLEYFPAAVAAFEDLDAPDALELLGKAPDPARAAKLTRAQVSAVLKRSGRYKITQRTDAILAALRSPQLGQPPVLTAAYAATVRSLTAVIATLNEQVASLQGQVEAHFGRHPDAEIYRSQPGLGAITGARVLGEFGDDPDRYASAKARRNYAGTSPITRASGKRKIVGGRRYLPIRAAEVLVWRYPGWERRWERVPLESALGRSRPLARARRVTWAGCIPAGCRLPNTFLGIKGSPAQIRPSPLVVKFFRIFPDEAPLGLGEILPVLGCHASLHLLRHGLEVALDVGEIFQVGECQAGLRLLHRGLRRVVVRPVAGRGGCALAGGQRQGGGRERGQGDGEAAGVVDGVHDGPSGEVGSAKVARGRGSCAGAGAQGGDQAADRGRVCGRGMPWLVGARAAGPAGGAGQRVTAGLAVPVGGQSFGQLVAAEGVHCGLLGWGLKWALSRGCG